MKVLDLFSGIGGFSLGLERAGMETVAFCEIEPFCQKVLAKHWPDVPIYSDITTLTRERLIADGVLADTGRSRIQQSGVNRNVGGDGGFKAGVYGHGIQSGEEEKGQDMGGKTIDLVCGGYPCQPFSHAGKRAGEKDDRHLWPEMYRIIETVRPRWVIAENVAGHITMGLDAVLSDLEAANYAWWTFVIPACAVDAKHRRDRVWIVASARPQEVSESGNGDWAADVAHAGGEGLPKPARGELREFHQTTERPQGRQFGGGNATPEQRTAWPTEPNVGGLADGLSAGLAGLGWLAEPGTGRVATGVPERVAKLKALGNAVVPQVVEVIGRAIMECQ